MKMHFTIRAFSLSELLVALAILAIVAAVLVPRFLNVQNQAEDSVALRMADQLNITYANWKAAGGQETSPSGISPMLDLLSVIGSAPGSTKSSKDGLVADGGASNTIGATLPDGITTSTILSAIAAGQNYVSGTKYTIASSGNPNAPLTVLPVSDLSQMSFTGTAYYPDNGSGTTPISQTSYTFSGGQLPAGQVALFAAHNDAIPAAIQTLPPLTASFQDMSPLPQFNQYLAVYYESINGYYLQVIVLVTKSSSQLEWGFLGTSYAITK